MLPLSLCLCETFYAVQLWLLVGSHVAGTGRNLLVSLPSASCVSLAVWFATHGFANIIAQYAITHQLTWCVFLLVTVTHPSLSG